MFARDFMNGLLEVLFPTICSVCGLKLSRQENRICAQCLMHKFDTAMDQQEADYSGKLLPNGVDLQHALWVFDKGGSLQDLLHQLKYDHLTGIGEDVGRQLGKSLLGNEAFIRQISDRKVRLIPVPLHPKKHRKRGYNQAYYIAKGISSVTKLPILRKSAVIRIKNTRTQTGFSLVKRQDNMKGAFRVSEARRIKNVYCVIVDDVFTTGATTFELATELNRHEPAGVAIATVAQA